MAKPQGRKKRDQTESILVRMRQIEREFLEMAAMKRNLELAKETPGATVQLGPLMRVRAIDWAQQVLGQTLEEYEREKPHVVGAMIEVATARAAYRKAEANVDALLAKTKKR
jgi:hypothetical protein